MVKKIRIAFIKYGGLSSGGTEKMLQIIAANLPKNRFAVDYFYCDSSPYIGSNYKHPETDESRIVASSAKNAHNAATVQRLTGGTVYSAACI